MRTFEGLLESDVNEVSRADIAKQILLASDGLLFLFFLDHGADVVLIGTRLEERRYEFGLNYLRVIPLRLPGFTVFTIEPLAREPLLVVGGFVEGRPFGRVPDHVALPELRRQGPHVPQSTEHMLHHYN